MEDCYSILGINENATSDEIKSAFRALMKIWHPDVCAEKDAYERFVKIVEAYELLSDPQQRRRYDEMRNASEDIALQDTNNNSITPFGCLIMVILIVLSLSFVAFIAYKVYLTLHGDSSITQPASIQTTVELF
ncbi:J domain-containing protein [Desulfosporosinus sp. SB140]|uniref:J domain-containing protein n=1 Tax=Desulfosporosinus paludis TaxID=3115649 RepID=UPI003890AD9A